MKELWFYKKAFCDLFQSVVETPLSLSPVPSLSPSLPAPLRHLLAFPLALNAWSQNATEFAPEERSEIGKEVSNLSNTFLSKIAQRTASLAHSLALECVALSRTLAPEMAQKTIMERLAKGQKMHKSESKSSGESARLSALLSSLCDICHSLSHSPRITVFNFAFSPREYLTEGIEMWLAKAIAQLAVCEGEAGVQRPSVCLANITAYISALRSLENYICIDISSIFSAVMLEQARVPEASPSPAASSSGAAPAGQTLASVYVAFYKDLLFRVVGSGQAAFSESRAAFVSRPQAPYRTEDYTDVVELRALCTLIGPTGVRVLNDHLLGAILSLTADLKKIVTGNSEALDVISSSVDNGPACLDAIRRLKDFDELSGKGSLLGATVVLRRQVLSSLASVLEARIPYIFSSIRDIHTHMKGAEAVDVLSLTAGLRSDIDPHLVRLFTKLTGASQQEYNTWTNLLSALACVLRTAGGSASGVYKASIDACENNNHLLAYVISDLTPALFTLAAPAVSEAPVYIRRALEDFLRRASVLLLRVVLEKESKSRDTGLIILNKVVEESGFLTSDALERFLPYSLVRMAFQETYKRKGRTADKDALAQ